MMFKKFPNTFSMAHDFLNEKLLTLLSLPENNLWLWSGVRRTSFWYNCIEWCNSNDKNLEKEMITINLTLGKDGWLHFKEIYLEINKSISSKASYGDAKFRDARYLIRKRTQNAEWNWTTFFYHTQKILRMKV